MASVSFDLRFENSISWLRSSSSVTPIPVLNVHSPPPLSTTSWGGTPWSEVQRPLWKSRRGVINGKDLSDPWTNCISPIEVCTVSPIRTETGNDWTLSRSRNWRHGGKGTDLLRPILTWEKGPDHPLPLLYSVRLEDRTTTGYRLRVFDHWG